MKTYEIHVHYGTSAVYKVTAKTLDAAIDEACDMLWRDIEYGEREPTIQATDWKEAMRPRRSKGTDRRRDMNTQSTGELLARIHSLKRIRDNRNHLAAAAFAVLDDIDAGTTLNRSHPSVIELAAALEESAIVKENK